MTNVIIIITLIIVIYILYRNRKVYDFQIKISEHCFDVLFSFLESLKDDSEFHKQHSQYEMLHKKAYEIMDKYSYVSMLFSFKPLKLESWFTKEEIDFMNLKTQKRE